METVAPGLGELGVMLPYAPLLELLALHHAGPLVATSGNISGSPILYRDVDAFEQLSGVADAFLVHTRDIVTPQDDSVVRFPATSKSPVIIRRSRGMAPASPTSLLSDWNVNILAMGSDLKSTLGWRRKGHNYISQYMGNLGSYESQNYLRELILHWGTLLGDRPDRILIDAHPGYFSHQMGEALALEWEVPVEKVFHHEAHAFALMAENGKTPSEDGIHILVWDGTGLGRDDAVWGGELFHYAEGTMERLAHLDYQAHWMGDKMSLEPRISALSFTRSLPEIQEQLMRHFSLQEWEWYGKLLQQVPRQLTSSTGRLFDAAAILSGWTGGRQYEGQAAMWLEARASEYVRQNGFPVAPSWEWKGHLWEPSALLAQVFVDAQKEGPGLASARFHSGMIELVCELVDRFGISRLGFSGGVFQNALLVQGIREKLGAEVSLFWHREFSPNDENISLGQLASVYFNEKRIAEATGTDGFQGTKKQGLCV